MTTNRDFAAEFIAARIESRSSDNLAERDAAWKKAASIARAARKAGVELDEVALDEQARRIVIAG